MTFIHVEQQSSSIGPIIGGVIGTGLVVVILVVVIVVVAVCTVKRKSLTKSVDLHDDVAHCSANPSYDTYMMRYILHHHVLIILLMEHSKLIIVCYSY